MKRHVLVDTQGLLMLAIVHAADIQDSDGGVVLMATKSGLFQFLLKLYADSYRGDIEEWRQVVVGAFACHGVDVDLSNSESHLPYVSGDHFRLALALPEAGPLASVPD